MRVLINKLLKDIVKKGALEVRYADGSAQKFGDGTGDWIVARFADSYAPIALMSNPELRFGELFMDGRIEIVQGDVYGLAALLSKNSVRGKPPKIMEPIRALNNLIAKATRNERTASRKNVAHHYDLDARLYDLFLDADRQYSCAYFETPQASLDEAQLAKKRHIAAKLLLRPGQKVLDIGCGWGGLALYLAEHCKVDVLGITLSTEQLAVARERAQKAGLAGPTRFELQDYRDTPGPFDRIVSVGMFEHVGQAHYIGFFEQIKKQLNDDGVALLHTIGRPDGPGGLNPWITKYIFPGAHLPGLSELIAAVEKAGLFVCDVEILRIHYADTLRKWRERFMARREEAKALYDERFCKMWEYYLAMTEVGFRFEGECVFQVQIARRHDVVPVTRDYMFEAEQALKAGPELP